MLDYHLARAERVGAGWVARCKCGWEGPQRDTRAAAADDELEHDLAGNDELAAERARAAPRGAARRGFGSAPPPDPKGS